MKTVLLVEDDPTFSRTIAAFLEDSGYQVLQASNGEEGLDMLGRERPDVVLTDLRMPVMDGFGFIARLRQASPKMPVIVVTGTGDTQAEAAVLEQGALCCIFKPIPDLRVLEQAIERALASIA